MSLQYHSSTTTLIIIANIRHTILNYSNYFVYITDFIIQVCYNVAVRLYCVCLLTN